MKNVIKIFGAISFILMSFGYFLWIYENEGFTISSQCLLIWGFCLSAYAIVLAVIYILSEGL